MCRNSQNEKEDLSADLSQCLYSLQKKHISKVLKLNYALQSLTSSADVL